ncbi:hypothetical protein Tco_0298073, partial [Tanacetum coccineum]
VLAIQKGRVNKPKPQANKKGKCKGKADKNKQVMAYQPKPKQNPPQKKENLKKDQACHHCNVLQGFRVERKLSYGEQYLCNAPTLKGRSITNMV